jgi:uncharacterized protein (DUF2164 family)
MVLAMLQKIEKYLSINLEVLLLYIKIILKINFISEKLSFCFLNLGAFSSVASLACLSY